MGANSTKPRPIKSDVEKSFDSEWKTSSSKIYLNKKIKKSETRCVAHLQCTDEINKNDGIENKNTAQSWKTNHLAKGQQHLCGDPLKPITSNAKSSIISKPNNIHQRPNIHRKVSKVNICLALAFI